MPTTASRTSVHATLLGPVADALTVHGITLALTSGTQTRGDAWCDATEQHGPVIAHIHLEDGHWPSLRHRPWGEGEWLPVTVLMVSYPWDAPDTANTILTVLRDNGLDATWDGYTESAIRIQLPAGG